MISVAPTRLHWIKDDGNDDPSDLCAHSPVLMEVGGSALVSPDDGDATVSAAAVYLLRTLERDHTKATPVGDQLFPCCGHAMYDTGEDDVVICGSPNGSDVYVTHEDNNTIHFTTPEGQRYVVSFNDWRLAVIQFSDCVQAFYDQSLPKNEDSDDGEGFAKMMAEWRRRRQHAETG
jgi:hypothetical protein